MPVYHVAVSSFLYDNYMTGFFLFAEQQSKNWHRIAKQLPVLKHGSMHAVVQELALFYLFRAVCVTDRCSKTSPKQFKEELWQYRQQQRNKKP